MPLHAHNVQAGYFAGGRFHPLRSSVDYDPDRAGDDYGARSDGLGPRYVTRRKKGKRVKVAKRKPAAKRKRKAVAKRGKKKSVKRNPPTQRALQVAYQRGVREGKELKKRGHKRTSPGWRTMVDTGMERSYRKGYQSGWKSNPSRSKSGAHRYEVRIPPSRDVGSYLLTITATTVRAARNEARDHMAHTRDWADTGKPMSKYRLPSGTKVKEIG